MNNLEIIDLWRAYDKKLDKCLSVSKDITLLKIQGSLSAMKPIKIFTILVVIIWLSLGVIVLSNLYSYALERISWFFFISASLQLLISAIALIIYLYQFILIQQVNISQPIISTQKRLAHLKSSTLWATRIGFLQLPVWTTFYWNESMFVNGNVLLYGLQTIVTLSFTGVALWLFFNIKLENSHKKWFRFLFSGAEWGPILKSQQFLQEIEDFELEQE